MNYTKGETAGGWIYIHAGKMPVALVHPKHLDKFLAAPDMYEALKKLIPELKRRHYIIPQSYEKALAKAEGKEV